MKFTDISILACLVPVALSSPVFAEEDLGAVMENISCEQEASDLGIQPGEEFDSFVVECQKSEALSLEDEALEDEAAAIE